MHKLDEGKPADFTGTAINSADGTAKAVTGKATPSDTQRGAVTFSISTDNGPLVFNTSYHFAP